MVLWILEYEFGFFDVMRFIVVLFNLLGYKIFFLFWYGFLILGIIGIYVKNILYIDRYLKG